MKLVGRNIAMQPTDMLALSIYFVGLAMVRPPPPVPPLRDCDSLYLAPLNLTYASAVDFKLK